MDELTQLDKAHARMQADESDDSARLSFFERVSDTEFLMLLEADPQGSSVNPKVFPVEDQEYVLIFDREERLAAFSNEVVPYVALSGRAIVNMLVAKNIGLGVNLGVGPSSILIPADAVDWLAMTLARGSNESLDRPATVSRPSDAPRELLTSLSTKLALRAGIAKSAFLVSAAYRDESSRLLLGIVDAQVGSEAALANAVSEALIFSGTEDATLDVAFFAATDPICVHLEKVGLRFDIPQPLKANRTPSAPGMDPERPPRLR